MRKERRNDVVGLDMNPNIEDFSTWQILCYRQKAKH